VLFLYNGSLGSWIFPCCHYKKHTLPHLQHGGVLYNNMGNMVVAYTRSCGGGSNNEDEALVLLWGFRIVRSHGINKLAIEGDSTLITKAGKGEGQSN
jgi:hypothetical protein